MQRVNDPLLQLPEKELGIGHTTWAYLSNEEDFLDPRTKKFSSTELEIST